jgi:hypothetical protein
VPDDTGGDEQGQQSIAYRKVVQVRILPFLLWIECGYLIRNQQKHRENHGKRSKRNGNSRSRIDDANRFLDCKS